MMRNIHTTQQKIISLIYSNFIYHLYRRKNRICTYLPRITYTQSLILLTPKYIDVGYLQLTDFQVAYAQSFTSSLTAKSIAIFNSTIQQKMLPVKIIENK
jgi:hypothetical protein